MFKEELGIGGVLGLLWFQKRWKFCPFSYLVHSVATFQLLQLLFARHCTSIDSHGEKLCQPLLCESWTKVLHHGSLRFVVNFFPQAARMCCQVHWDVFDGHRGSWACSVWCPQHNSVCQSWKGSHLIPGLRTAHYCKMVMSTQMCGGTFVFAQNKRLFQRAKLSVSGRQVWRGSGWSSEAVQWGIRCRHDTNGVCQLHEEEGRADHGNWPQGQICEFSWNSEILCRRWNKHQPAVYGNDLKICSTPLWPKLNHEMQQSSMWLRGYVIMCLYSVSSDQQSRHESCHPEGICSEKFPCYPTPGLCLWSWENHNVEGNVHLAPTQGEVPASFSMVSNQPYSLFIAETKPNPECGWLYWCCNGGSASQLRQLHEVGIASSALPKIRLLPLVKPKHNAAILESHICCEWFVQGRSSGVCGNWCSEWTLCSWQEHWLHRLVQWLNIDMCYIIIWPTPPPLPHTHTTFELGFAGHFLDQKRLKQGLYRHPWDDISYVMPEQYDQ